MHPLAAQISKWRRNSFQASEIDRLLVRRSGLLAHHLLMHASSLLPGAIPSGTMNQTNPAGCNAKPLASKRGMSLARLSRLRLSGGCVRSKVAAAQAASGVPTWANGFAGAYLRKVPLEPEGCPNDLGECSACLIQVGAFFLREHFNPPRMTN